MFEYFKKTRRVARAGREIVSLLVGPLSFARGSSGALDPKIAKDEFILAYIFGGICACLKPFDVADDEEKAMLVRYVYKEIFHDVRLAEVCSMKAVQRDPAFIEVMDTAYNEIEACFSTRGEKIPKSMLDHVSANY